MSRPSKREYYLDIARKIGERSTCFRNGLGAIIVKNDQIVATGYIGACRKTKDCLERGKCLRDVLEIGHGERYEICRSVHAEQNAIINAARSGASILGGEMYVSGTKANGENIDAFPCYICKKMIINAGLETVICSNKQGGYEVFSVNEWVEDWQKKDLLDDQKKYGSDQNNK